MTLSHTALDQLPDAAFADLHESESAYLLVVDLPGVTAQRLDIHTEADRISVQAERPTTVPEEFGPVREQRSGELELDFPLPRDATGADASAAIDSGVLELTLPKADAAAQEIPVESPSQAT